MVAACGALVCQVKTRTKVKGLRDCDGAKASVGRLADGGRTAGEVYGGLYIYSIT
jgi:hypothetical protein